jgi:hypothetical protein
MITRHPREHNCNPGVSEFTQLQKVRDKLGKRSAVGACENSWRSSLVQFFAAGFLEYLRKHRRLPRCFYLPRDLRSCRQPLTQENDPGMPRWLNWQIDGGVLARHLLYSCERRFRETIDSGVSRRHRNRSQGNPRNHFIVQNVSPPQVCSRQGSQPWSVQQIEMNRRSVSH